MPSSQFLSSSRLTTLGKSVIVLPCEKEVNELLETVLEVHGPAMAIRAYSCAVFEVPFIFCEESVKKGVLQELWKAILVYLDQDFEVRVASGAALIVETSANQLSYPEYTGTFHLGITEVMNDMRLERIRSVKLGRCSFVIETMTDPRGCLDRDSLVYVERILR